MGMYISVNYNSIYDAAKKIAQEATEAEQTANDFKLAKKDLALIWRGRSADALEANGEAWISEMNGIAASLRNLSSNLRSIADAYKREDERLAAEARRRAEEARRRAAESRVASVK